MKPILTTYLICIAFLSSTLANAQEADSSNASQTILEVKNPYKKARTKWLNSSGFDTETYDWNDPQINLYIEKAVKRRTKATILGITGGGVLALGLFANFVGSVFHEDPNGVEEYQIMKGPYYLGGAMAVTSIALSFDSIAKVNKAKAARAKKSK